MSGLGVLGFAGLQAVLGVYVIVLAGGLLIVLQRYLPRRAAMTGSLSLLAWLGYAGVVGWMGLLRDPTLRPPGIVWLALPAVLGVFAFIVRGPGGRVLALALPLWLVLGLQGFHIGVEAVLHSLWELGQVPRLMTLSGGNVEMVVALTAPLAAWLSTRGRGGRPLALVWNTVGLLSLLNVVVRGVLTAPGPLQWVRGELPDLAIGHFPFTYIPGFMVPLALILHMLAFRILRGGAPDR